MQGAQQSQSATSVGLVEDHPLMSEALAQLLTRHGFCISWQAGSSQQALALVNNNCPDLLVVDLGLPDLPGDELMRSLRMMGFDVPVVVVTAEVNAVRAAQLLASGARGFLTKQLTGHMLPDMLHNVVQGQIAVDPSIAGQVLTLLHNPPRPVLTDREHEVVRLLCQGYTATSDLAERMWVSQRTVKAHLEHIFTKLNVTDRAGVVAAAYLTGLVSV